MDKTIIKPSKTREYDAPESRYKEKYRAYRLGSQNRQARQNRKN